MMKIVDWKKLFAPHILDRGLRYYEEGLVKIEAMDGGSIEAAVEGTDTYCVEILVREGHVMQMDCDCPYARDGNNCKHMAAVLLAAEDEESTIDLHRADNSSWENDRSAPTDRELEQAVAAFSEEQVRKLLLDAAKRHGDVRNRIVLSGKAAIDPSLPIRWETELSMISRRASDRDGSIDYSHAFAYTTELSEYLDENIEPLLENDLVMDAFRLVGLVFLEAMSQEMDDSDGGLSLLASDCVAYWERLIPSPKADQHKMLDWFQAQIKRFFGEFAEDVLWSVTLECFTDADLLTQILAMADSQIRSANEFSLQGAIERRIALMERMGASDSEIRAYRKDHWAMPFIRNQELDRLEQKKRWDEALALLQECEQMDADDPYLLKKYSERRIRILKLSRRKMALQEALQQHIFRFPQWDMTYVLEWKELVSEEQWQGLLPQLFQSETTRRLRRELQLSEGMLEQMMAELEASRDPYEIGRYKKELRKVFPERVRDLLLKQLDRQMRSASSRDAYAKVARELKHLYGYPEGREKVKGLAAAWRKDYPRRSAMLDELDKMKL